MFIAAFSMEGTLRYEPKNPGLEPDHSLVSHWENTAVTSVGQENLVAEVVTQALWQAFHSSRGWLLA